MPVKKREKVRTRCMSPLRERNGRITERFCMALDKVMLPDPNSRRSGISVYQGINMKTGEPRIFGVAARVSAKEKAIFFKVCPFCGCPLDWYWSRYVKKRKKEEPMLVSRGKERKAA